MEVNETTTLKLDYNKTLKRYYKGCTYLSEHPEQFNNYFGEIQKLQNRLNELILEIEYKEKRHLTSNEILEGFYDIEKGI